MRSRLECLAGRRKWIVAGMRGFRADEGSLRIAAKYRAQTEAGLAAMSRCSNRRVLALRDCRFARADNDLSSGVSFSLVPESFGHVAQGVAPIEDRGDLSGFNELLQNSEVLSVVPHDEHTHPLAHERR